MSQARYSLSNPLGIAAVHLINALAESDGAWLLEEIEPGLHYILIDGERKRESYEEIFGSVPKQSRSFLLDVNEMKRKRTAFPSGHGIDAD